MATSHNFTEALRIFYNNVGSQYNVAQASKRHLTDASVLVDIAGSNVKEGSWILDLATGTGNIAFEAAARVGASGRVLGVDLSPIFVEHAKSTAIERGLDSHVHFICQDVVNLSLPSIYSECRPFDAVFCASSIMLFPDPVTIIRKVSRELLKSDGVFIANVHKSILGALFFDIAVAQGIITAMDPVWATQPEYGLRRAFGDAGMDVEVISKVDSVGLVKWDVGTSDARTKLWETVVVKAPWVSFGIDFTDEKLIEVKAIWDQKVLSYAESDGFINDRIAHFVATAVNKH